MVGRSRAKLENVEKAIQERGGQAISVVADLSDITGARRAAAEIAALDLPPAGLLNNAGIMAMHPFHSAQGWDGTFVDGLVFQTRPTPATAPPACYARPGLWRRPASAPLAALGPI